MGDEDRAVDPRAPLRQLVSMERDVLVLSAAMFAFSLGFQMTSRYVPRYLSVLGAGAGVIGLYGSLGNLISAVYPDPGGTVSDRLGSRRALTAFGLLSALGFLCLLLAPRLGTVVVGPVAVPPWAWIFVGLFLTQAWKLLGLGASAPDSPASSIGVEPARTRVSSVNSTVISALSARSKRPSTAPVLRAATAPMETVTAYVPSRATLSP